MSTPCYLKAQGQRQGLITANAFTPDSVGNIFVEGHEDEILINAVDHMIRVPTDAQSGQPTGQRVHEPLAVMCAMNRSVPLFLNALVTGERLEEVCLSWYRTSIEGRQEQFFSYVLEDAIINQLHIILPDTISPTSQDYTQLVNISFSYRKIILEHTQSGTSGSDDWRSPLDA